MKKAMLYISIVMSVIYAAAVCLVIVFQKAIGGSMIGGMSGEIPFVVPGFSLFICAVTVIVSIVFNVLLQRTADDERTVMETAALIVFSLLIVLMPWITGLGNILQSNYYARIIGVNGLAAYNIVAQGIAACNPLLIFSMLLQVIYGGISLGGKGH